MLVDDEGAFRCGKLAMVKSGRGSVIFPGDLPPIFVLLGKGMDLRVYPGYWNMQIQQKG